MNDFTKNMAQALFNQDKINDLLRKELQQAVNDLLEAELTAFLGYDPYVVMLEFLLRRISSFLYMLISGGFAGIGGVVQGLGTYQNYFTQTSSINIGWDGLSVALLGNSTAIGILIAYLLFSILKIGGLGMQTVAGVPYEIVSIVIAAIIFFIAIKYVFDLLFAVKKGTEIGPNNGVDGPNIKLQKEEPVL